MFLLYSLSLGAPFGPLGLGAPGFARSEPIVVTPLTASVLNGLKSNPSLKYTLSGAAKIKTTVDVNEHDFLSDIKPPTR